MHQDIADMDHIKAPALLAYRGGDVFATIVDVLRNIPRGRSCSADSLEDLLKLCVSRALVHSPLKRLLMMIPDTACYDTFFAVTFSAVRIYKHSSKASWLFLRDRSPLHDLLDLTCLSFFFFFTLSNNLLPHLSLSLVSLLLDASSALKQPRKDFLEMALVTRMGSVGLGLG
jgi:hypothetical protein